MSAIRRSAKHQACQMRFPFVCNFDPATTVLAHANGSAAGKGLGGKSPDYLGCFACSDCHDLYDRRRPLPDGVTREQVDLAFADGHFRTLRILNERDLVRTA